MTTLLETLLAWEANVSYTQLPPPDQPEFTHKFGSIPILISAPHSTAHERNGRIKEEEEFTSAFAQHIANLTGAHAFYTQYQSARDPNWYSDAPYKQALHHTIKQHNIQFVLDLHGMSNRYKIGLALGTMNGRSCPAYEPALLNSLHEGGFTSVSQKTARTIKKIKWDHLIVNHKRFTGGLASDTITRFVSQNIGVPAAQLELSSSVRIVRRGSHRGWRMPFYGDPVAIETAVTTLIALIHNVHHAICQKTQV